MVGAQPSAPDSRYLFDSIDNSLLTVSNVLRDVPARPFDPDRCAYRRNTRHAHEWCTDAVCYTRRWVVSHHFFAPLESNSIEIAESDQIFKTRYILKCNVRHTQANTKPEKFNPQQAQAPIPNPQSQPLQPPRSSTSRLQAPHTADSKPRW